MFARLKLREFDKFTVISSPQYITQNPLFKKVDFDQESQPNSLKSGSLSDFQQRLNASVEKSKPLLAARRVRKKGTQLSMLVLSLSQELMNEDFDHKLETMESELEETEDDKGKEEN